MMIKSKPSFIRDNNTVKFNRITVKGSIFDSLEKLRSMNIDMITALNQRDMAFMNNCPEKFLRLDFMPSVHMKLFRLYIGTMNATCVEVFNNFVSLVSERTLEAYKYDEEIMSIANIICDALEEMRADNAPASTIQSVRSFVTKLDSEMVISFLYNELRNVSSCIECK